MGPVATGFWLRLQSLIEHPEWVKNFPKIVDIFGLTIAAPGDTITIETKGLSARRDARDLRYGVMENIGYGISQDQYDKNLRSIGLFFQVNISNICITPSEVRRLYGRGHVGFVVPEYLPPGHLTDQTGLRFSESYGGAPETSARAPVIFRYAPSGCLEAMQFQQVLNNSN